MLGLVGSARLDESQGRGRSFDARETAKGCPARTRLTGARPRKIRVSEGAWPPGHTCFNRKLWLWLKLDGDFIQMLLDAAASIQFPGRTMCDAMA